MAPNKKEETQLFELLASVTSPKEIKMLFDDLCTYKEVEYMSQRVQCAKLFMEGHTYQQIMSQVDISTATLGRINKCIQRGSGGYSKILAHYLEEKKHEQN